MLFSSPQGHNSGMAEIAVDEATQRHMLQETVAMFYALRVMPVWRQLLVDRESFERTIWIDLRRREFLAILRIAMVESEAHCRREFLRQFLFERELLLEPQFVVLEELTRQDLMRHERNDRRFLSDFSVEERVMLMRHHWMALDPANDHATSTPRQVFSARQQRGGSSSSRPSTSATATPMTQSPHRAHYRSHPLAASCSKNDPDAAIFDSYFTPSMPPTERRGWRPTSAKTRDNETTPLSEGRRPRPSTASIYRNRAENILRTPGQRKHRHGDDGTPISSSPRSPPDKPAHHNVRASPTPGKVPQDSAMNSASGSRSQSRLVLLNHFIPRPNGENHREEPYFTSHYCHTSPIPVQPATASLHPGGTPRPMSSMRSSSASSQLLSKSGKKRPNHGAPLLLLAEGKGPSIVETKALLQQLTLEDVERVVPLIRMSQLDLRNLAKNKAQAGSRRLFSSKQTSRSPQHHPHPGRESSHNHDSYLAEAMDVLNQEHLDELEPHIASFLMQHRDNAALGSNNNSSKGSPLKCRWCQETKKKHTHDVMSSPTPPLHSTSSPQQSFNRMQLFAGMSNSATKGHATADQRPATILTQMDRSSATPIRPSAGVPTSASKGTSPHALVSLQEHLIREYPFLSRLDQDRDLCGVRIGFLDPQRDNEFARRAREWKQMSETAENSPQEGTVQNLAGADPPGRLNVEQQLLERCRVLASQYVKTRLLGEYPFLPHQVDGVGVERLGLLDNDAFYKIADEARGERPLASSPANRRSHESEARHRIATDNLSRFLTSQSQRWQAGQLRMLLPEVFVDPPALTFPFADAPAAYDAEWSEFRRTFSLYAASPESLSLWTNEVFAKGMHRMSIMREVPAAPSNAANNDEERKQLIRMVLDRARSFRKQELQRALGIAGSITGWSLDEAEPYLLCGSGGTKVPPPTDLTRCLITALDTTDISLVTDRESAAEARIRSAHHLALFDWCPFLVSQESLSPETTSAARGGVLLMKSTTDILNEDENQLPLIPVTRETMCHVDFFGDGPFMGLLRTWLDLVREHESVNTNRHVPSRYSSVGTLFHDLELKMRRRAAVLLNASQQIWIKAEAQRRELERAHSSWIECADTMCNLLEWKKRLVWTQAEESIHRQSFTVRHTALLLITLLPTMYRERESLILDESLRCKEQYFFVCVALSKRQMYIDDVVQPALERLYDQLQKTHVGIVGDQKARERIMLREQEEREDTIVSKEASEWVYIKSLYAEVHRQDQIQRQRRLAAVAGLWELERHERSSLWRAEETQRLRLASLMVSQAEELDWLIKDELFSRQAIDSGATLNEIEAMEQEEFSRLTALSRRRASVQLLQEQAVLRRQQQTLPATGSPTHARTPALYRRSSSVTPALLITDSEMQSRRDIVDEEQVHWTDWLSSFRSQTAVLRSGEAARVAELRDRVTIVQEEASQRSAIGYRCREGILRDQALQQENIAVRRSTSQFSTIFSGIDDVVQQQHTHVVRISGEETSTSRSGNGSSADADRRYMEATR